MKTINDIVINNPLHKKAFTIGKLIKQKTYVKCINALVINLEYLIVNVKALCMRYVKYTKDSFIRRKHDFYGV